MIEPVHESSIRVCISDTALLCNMTMIFFKDIYVYYWKENLHKNITSEYSYFYEEFTWSSAQFSSVAQLCPTLWPHGLQHARPSCPLPTSGVYSNLCPLSQWCHPVISSSIVPFSSCLQSFPASWSFQMSQFFSSNGKILKFQLQHQFFQLIFRTNFL